VVDEKALSEAIGHLGAALAQSISSDDQVVTGHVREAYRLLGGDPSRYVGYPWTRAVQDRAPQEFVVRRPGQKPMVYPWTRVRLNLRLVGGDVVDRYELWPIEREHVGVDKVMAIDVGRKYVLDISVSNRNWSMIDYITDV